MKDGDPVKQQHATLSGVLTIILRTGVPKTDLESGKTSNELNNLAFGFVTPLQHFMF